MYFKKVEQIFSSNIKSSILFKLPQLVPQARPIIGKIFGGISTVWMFINMLLSALKSKRQLPERPDMWLLNRLHPVIDQRQQTPTSRVDVLQLMLQVITDEQIIVSKIWQT